MCDTMVALGNSTADGRVLFAKNSDRQPNECHIMIRVPRRKYEKGSKVKCTYIEIDQVKETYEVLLLKPHWIWGAEMGCNEYGLNIGNEAVFTKEPKGKDSLIGMDMLRIALERCKSSREALDMMVELLEQYGQGGNCGYEKSFTYHNSFLIADRSSAWVLETAGSYWAAVEVKDVYSISNRLSISNKYDLAHPELVSHAIEKGWCKDESDFDFSKCYSDPIITKLSGSGERRSCSQKILDEKKGKITVETMKNILRSHTDNYERKPYQKSSVSSVCMHAGFIYGDQTTGSYIASLGEPLDDYLVTGSSAPCLSIFKPLWLTEGEPITFSQEDEAKAINYWKHREKFHRYVLENRIPLDEYIEARDRLEDSISDMVNEIKKVPDSNPKKLNEIMTNATLEEAALLDRYIAVAEANKPALKGNPYFRYYWRRKNRTRY